MPRQRTAVSRLQAQMLDRGVYDIDEYEAWLAERGWSWKQLERGDYDITVEESLVMFTFECPLRWAETYLFEPDSGDPYRFWDYQRESVRAWMQDVVHQDGAECGKTREIIALIAWAGCTAVGGRVANPWSLVAAPQQTHLDEIILALEEQFGVAEGMPQKTLISHFWMKPKRTPHMMHRFLSPNPLRPDKPSIARTYYRPGGHDGEAFRGVHVNAFGLFDEAAKVKNKTIFSEFWRALKPGCRSRLYSVPDGDRGSEYFRQTQQAVINLPVGKAGSRLFRWQQTMKPAPFWSQEREADMVRRFNGRNTPGYQRNVLGEHGQAENPVWPWGALLPNVVESQGYRVFRLHADAEADTLNIEVQAVRLTMTDGRKAGEYEWREDTSVALSPLLKGRDEDRRRAMRDILRPHLAAIASGVFWAGADLGERNDPTEIILSEEVGTVLHDRVRIQARGFPYHLQDELIYVLDGLFGHLPFWGVDLGSAGTTVVKDLISVDRFADASFEDRMVGFHFQQSVECIGEDGAVLEDEDPRTGERKIRVAPAKHWATQCISARLQDGGYALPYDTDALNAMATQTAREGAKWPIYSKNDDHHPDARRQQMLRKLRALIDDGAGVDVFAASATRRNAA
ncbi:hypothetical protein DYQ93_11395 [Xanthomonas sp. LMG 8992]|uniref:hypothetical protein n=1 Tax=Xanthomonas sp. LMG 8992 TaxID=1591157 RepID=UPI0013719100|nr:hypothetical protein [Xanthomonas sp. LMG 8992]MXV11624.1 hypothetical protein [Xanthomonas sp. LMG 8992]